MRLFVTLAAAALILASGCTDGQTAPGANEASRKTPSKTENYAGFDRNGYPSDAALPELRKRFAFTGYWLNDPPGASRNTWTGKRSELVRQGFGFLVLFNGRVDTQLLASAKRSVPPMALGKKDAELAIAAAHSEGFPAGTILYLDQEEGGRLLPEAAQYLFAWTEAVAKSVYKPGVYASGIPADDGNDAHGKPVTITTAQDIQQEVAAKRLAPVSLYVYQDSCPPSNGCTVTPPPLSQSGTASAAVWQYAQSPRRPDVTRACVKSYAADGNCYATQAGTVFVDLDVAQSSDPSHGR